MIARNRDVGEVRGLMEAVRYHLHILLLHREILTRILSVRRRLLRLTMTGSVRQKQKQLLPIMTGEAEPVNSV
jgi:hypothetical protein